MKRFNLRVYGLFINDQQEALVSEEIIHGTRIIKFPGGGLEFGEGLTEGLKREWKEELEADIDVIAHYYTTDFFQPSAWDDSQVISIYYLVKPLGNLEFPYYNNKERFYFLPLKALSHKMDLPIDKVVAVMLEKQPIP
jgi:ADP-ribose pyrophosphatase YjhB (NUDIX family)